MSKYPRWVDFGKKLKDCRDSVNLSQRELAESIGKSVSLISKIETGDHHPDNELFQKILSKLRLKHVPLEALEALERAHVPSGTFKLTPQQFPNEYPTMQFIAQALKSKDVDPIDKQALMNDLEQIVRSWKKMWEGERVLKLGKFRDTKIIFEEVSSEIPNAGERLRIRVLEGLSSLRRYEGSTSAAIAYLEAADVIAKECGSPEELTHARILQNMGNIYRRLGNWVKTEENYQQSLAIYKKWKRDNGVADLLRKAAGLRNYQGKSNEALALCRESEKICDRINYNDGQWKVWQHEAWAYAMIGQIDRALELHKKAIDFAVRLKVHPRSLAKSHRFLADAYRMANNLTAAKNEYDKALQYLDDAFSKEDVQEERIIRGTIFTGLGSLHLNLMNYGEASRFLRNGLLLQLQVNDKYYQGLSLNQLGRLYTEISDFVSAQESLQKAYLIFTNPDEALNPYYETAVLINQAYLNLRMETYDKATSLITSAIKIGKEFDFNTHLARAEVLLATVYAYMPERKIGEIINNINDAVQTAVQLHESALVEIFNYVNKIIELISKADIGKARQLCEGILSYWQSSHLDLTSSAFDVLQRSLLQIMHHSEKLEIVLKGASLT